MTRLIDTLTDEERELTRSVKDLRAKVADLNRRRQLHEEEVRKKEALVQSLDADIATMKDEKHRLVEDLRRKRQHHTWAKHG